MALEKFQLAKNKTIDFINKKLRQKNEAKAYINNFDEAIVEYYQVFAKQKNPNVWTSVIRILRSNSWSEKWWTIICCKGYRPGNMCSLQVP